MNLTDPTELQVLRGDPRTHVLITIVEALHKAGVDYAFIHGDAGAWPDVNSDVDIAFAQPPAQTLEPVLDALERSGQFRIVQRLHYDVPHAYYYILQVPNQHELFLHLDCLCDAEGSNRYRLPTTLLLDGAVQTPFGRRVNRHNETLYLLMKRAVKGRVSAHALTQLHERLRTSTAALWNDVEEWFGPNANAALEELLACSEPAQAAKPLRQLRAGADRVALWHKPWQRWFGALRRGWQRLLQPSGLFVVILGPDGSGKSTVTGLVQAQLERAFRRTWRFHWRPGLLPKLRPDRPARVVSPLEAPAAPPSTLRRLISLARFTYYWLDFVLGYWLVIYPRKARTTLVLGERYFPDVLVHPQRYDFDVPQRLLRIAARFVPSPDLLVLLQGEAQAIYARKGELSPALIEQQMRGYRNEAYQWRAHALVDTAAGAQAVAAQVAELILSECAHRTRGARGVAAASRWHAFPTAREAKVWFDCAAPVADALRLYRPYARLARFSVRLVGALPQRIALLLLKGRADCATAQRLERLTETVRRVLNDPALTVSFFVGTPGPHGKLTAQVSRPNEVVSYVKIGSERQVHALLQHEAQMLEWLAVQDFRAAAIPAVQALSHVGDDVLLFLTPPGGTQLASTAGRQRGLGVDHDDAQALLALDALEPGHASIEQVFTGLRVREYAEAARPEVATLVRTAIAACSALFERTGVRTVTCHGDFAPWNTLEQFDGRTFLFDWEYAQRGGVALGDMLHRVLSAPRLIARERASVAVERLLRTPYDPTLASLFAQSKIDSAALPGYVLLYLLQQLVQRPNALDRPDPYLLAALEHACAVVRPRADRPHVLVAAYACEPEAATEAVVGWRMCQAISVEHEVWALTCATQRARIDAACARQPNPHLRFAYVALPAWAERWKRNEWGEQLYYFLWQFFAYRAARALLRTQRFDLAHHVTLGRDYAFSFLGLLALPLVWGPIGSNDPMHAVLAENRRALYAQRLRWWLRTLRRTFDPLVWLCALRSRVVIGTHAGVLRQVPFSLREAATNAIHPATGVEHQLIGGAQRQAGGEPDTNPARFNVLSIAKLTPAGRARLALQAFALLAHKQPDALLTLVGDGPSREALTQLARELGVEQRVRFISRLPRAEALGLMRASDVFLHTGPAANGVVLEALAHGVPVIALRGAGVEEMLAGEGGFVVQPGDAAQTAKRLAVCMQSLAHDAARRARMGAAARRLVRERYLWEQRHLAIRNWYGAAGLYAQPRLEEAIEGGSVQSAY